MRTFRKIISIGILGEVWAKETCSLIRQARICKHVSVFEYTDRESLFFDQYDFFLVTDFGNDPTSGYDGERLIKLNQMREIIASRSMRTVMFINDDDPDVSHSSREACCRLIRLNNFSFGSVPYAFAEKLLVEICRKQDTHGQIHHSLPKDFKIGRAVA
ncbi:MAG: hypothetical protein RLY43_1502 [Bacteroidota bacterium]|jgi:hypothetical protein